MSSDARHLDHVLPLSRENPHELCWHYPSLPVADRGRVLSVVSVLLVFALDTDPDVRDGAMNAAQLSLNLAFTVSKLCLSLFFPTVLHYPLLSEYGHLFFFF